MLGVISVTLWLESTVTHFSWLPLSETHRDLLCRFLQRRCDPLAPSDCNPQTHVSPRLPLMREVAFRFSEKTEGETITYINSI